LMNVASAIKLNGNTIDQIRIAVNAVSPRPMRLKAVEDAVRGKTADADTGEVAGKLAVEGAVPLQFNGYKIPLMRNLVKRAIVGAALPPSTGAMAANAAAEEATCRS